MLRSVSLIFFGLLIGGILGYFLLFRTSLIPLQVVHVSRKELAIIEDKKQVIGFLPYWLMDKAQDDYAKEITTLTYFGLTIDTDGKIVRLQNEQEEDPGWTTLGSSKLAKKLLVAKEKNLTLSLLIFSGDSEKINSLLDDPEAHGKNLVADVAPLMKKYGFTDLNLDIESTKDASDEARLRFTQFVKTVKQELLANPELTLSLEVTGNDLIKKNLIDPKSVAPFIDSLIIMAYDFHYQGSSVTGPVSPLGGGGEEAEFDTKIVVQEAEKIISPKKIILGIPSYGYQWETLDPSVRSGVIPGSGVTYSNRRAEDLLQNCATCSAQFDEIANEAYVVYKDEETGTYHQLFFPTKQATQAKVSYALDQKLGGLAVWAMGYEGNTVLEPLKEYIQ